MRVCVCICLWGWVGVGVSHRGLMTIIIRSLCCSRILACAPAVPKAIDLLVLLFYRYRMYCRPLFRFSRLFPSFRGVGSVKTPTVVKRKG